MPVDHSTLSEKIAIRQAGLSFIEQPYRVIDLFAGSGLITQHLWSKVAERILCIEQKAGKFVFTSDNVELIESSCVEHIHRCSEFNVIDFDPYYVNWSVFSEVLNFAAEKSVVFLTVSEFTYNKNKMIECVARDDVKAFKMMFSKFANGIAYCFFVK